MTFCKAALLASGSCLLMVAACSDPASTSAAAPPAVAPPVASTLPALAVAEAPMAASSSPVAQAIDKASWSMTPTDPQAKRDAFIRAQVLLSRAHFSPGVIDGQDGGNMQNAVSSFEGAHNLPVDGVMDDQVWSALAQDTGPVMTDYTITAEDQKGPFLGKIPTDYTEMSKLPALGFTTPLEALAEKFHMDEVLLTALNPGADFGKAGTTILVAMPQADKLAATVTRIEVDKGRRQVRAYGDADKLLAVYPATVGSSERPAPEGEWAVRTVAPSPTYTYDPSRLTFGKASQGKLTIKAGPNNPVGGTWIDLTKDTFGIHGTPDPRLVGKAASHGCVRLTNWDAKQLAAAVKAGTKVAFVGVERPTAKKA